MAAGVERALSIANKLGEGPVWNSDEQRLYWVDIEGHCFYRYCPTTGEVEVFEVGLPVSKLALRSSVGFVMATRDGFAFWDSTTRALRFIVNPEANNPGTRFNDGAVDRQGRFWVGTIGSDGMSRLYRLDTDLSVCIMETDVIASNGIGWSPDDRIMYFTDSRRRVIYAYDFDVGTGTIENRRPFVRVTDEAGVPDGLAVDSEGFVWSACWGGWRVNRYDPNGKLEREIRLPVQYPSSCTFGGEHLDVLFITSAWTRLGEEQRRRQPYAGDLFLLRTHVRGLGESKFAG